MYTQTLIRIISFLLTVLFLYTALSKLLDIATFQRQLANQHIPRWTVPYLAMAIPGTELIIAGCLISSSFRRLGLYLSAFLMLIFTVYISLVLFDFFGSLPCNCGGVISSMRFSTHLVFNLFFLSIAILGVNLANSSVQPVDRS
ncbi:MAG TPA: MauE/DoxX family redox-associated membrane protein [Dyadobacter sp.]|jgi:hypothetical protein|nr:MauE/DoxX family redox-associated membrane protein [Dyadobacter sp.]